MNALLDKIKKRPDLFVESISNFYTNLVKSQEPLGVEFSRVLHENLWDLYERQLAPNMSISTEAIQTHIP